MGDWKDYYDGVFFISVITIFVGFLGLAVRYCLKSKCEQFSLCCGLITVNRRVDLEVQEEIAELNMNKDESKNKTSSTQDIESESKEEI